MNNGHMPFNPKNANFYASQIRKAYLLYCNIKEVTSTKYLGVLIDHKHTWNDHIQSIAHKVRKSFFISQLKTMSCTYQGYYVISPWSHRYLTRHGIGKLLRDINKFTFKILFLESLL